MAYGTAYFEVDFDAIPLASDTLNRPSILGDEGISNYLISQLDAELSEVACEANLVSHVKHAVRQSLNAPQQTRGRKTSARYGRASGPSE